MKNTILTLALLLISSRNSYAATFQPLPQAWTTPSAKESIERLIRTNSLALDELTRREAADPQISKLGRFDWSLRTVQADLTLSVSGLLALMIAKGDASTNLIWRRRGEPAPKIAEKNPADLTIPGEATEQQIAELLEPVIRGALASGQIDDETAFRKNLMSTAVKYQRVVQGVARREKREWWMERLRLELQIEGSGHVHVVNTAGGSLRLRLDWEPPLNAPGGLHRDNELGPIIDAVSETLQAVVAEVPSGPEGFDPHQATFGLGITTSGNFGVFKGSAHVAGTIVLQRDSTRVWQPISLRGKSIPVVYNGKVHEVASSAFRNGLKRALHISNYIGDRANASQGKFWELYGLASGFGLSLSGMLGLVELGGTGSVGLSFLKKFIPNQQPPAKVEASFAPPVQPIPELKNFTSETVRNVTRAIASAAAPFEPSQVALRRFYLRIQGKIGISVPGADFELVPELEVAIQKEKN